MAESEPVAIGIYTSQLKLQKEGYPLWDPTHNVEIADVGYVQHGAFVQLFNASIPSGDERNIFGVPENYIPLQVGEIQERASLPANIPIQSESVMQIKTEASLSGGVIAQLGGGFNFQCSKQQGAVLLLGDDADRQDALCKLSFLRYIRHYHGSWLSFANDVRNRGIALDDLVLVTGCDRTSAWAVAAFSGKSNEAGINFQISSMGVAQGGVSVWGAWHTCSSAVTRSGPRRPVHPTIPCLVGSLSSYQQSHSPSSPVSHLIGRGDTGPTPLAADADGDIIMRDDTVGRSWPRNQCVFLRGYKMCDKRTALARLLVRKKIYNGFDHVTPDRTESKDQGSSSTSSSITSTSNASYLAQRVVASAQHSQRSMRYYQYAPDSSRAPQSPPDPRNVSPLTNVAPATTLKQDPLSSGQLQHLGYRPGASTPRGMLPPLRNQFPEFFEQPTLPPISNVGQPSAATSLQQQVAQNTRLIFCKECGEWFNTPGDLEAHVWKCTQEWHNSLSYNQMMELLQRFNAGEHEQFLQRPPVAVAVAEARKHVCGECGERFDRPSGLETHIRSHTQERPFLCRNPGCNKAFTIRSNLRRHERTHAADSSFEGDEKESPTSSNYYSSSRRNVVPQAIDDKPSPLDVLLEYILENSLAILAVVHNDDLIALIENDTSIADFEAWLREVSPKIFIGDGEVGMIEPTYRLWLMQ